MRGNRGQGRGNPYNASAMFNSERALNIRRKMVFLYVGDNGGQFFKKNYRFSVCFSPITVKGGKTANFVNKNKQIYLFIFAKVYEGVRRNPA